MASFLPGHLSGVCLRSAGLEALLEEDDYGRRRKGGRRIFFILEVMLR